MISFKSLLTESTQTLYHIVIPCQNMDKVNFLICRLRNLQISQMDPMLSTGMLKRNIPFCFELDGGHYIPFCFELAIRFTGNVSLQPSRPYFKDIYTTHGRQLTGVNLKCIDQ